eukprot:7994605-Pyramimonas_sp.AAC.1
MQEAWVYSHDGPIRCRKRGYILTADLLDGHHYPLLRPRHGGHDLLVVAPQSQRPRAGVGPQVGVEAVHVRQ